MKRSYNSMSSGDMMSSRSTYPASCHQHGIDNHPSAIGPWCLYPLCVTNGCSVRRYHYASHCCILGNARRDQDIDQALHHHGRHSTPSIQFVDVPETSSNALFYHRSRNSGRLRCWHSTDFWNVQYLHAIKAADRYSDSQQRSHLLTKLHESADSNLLSLICSVEASNNYPTMGLVCQYLTGESVIDNMIQY